MNESLLHTAVPLGELALRAAGIYIALLVALRLFGKREVGQFTLFDLVFVLLVANAVQPAMTGPDSSLTGGLVIIVTLVSLNAVIGRLRRRSKFFNRLIEPQPTVVATNGKWDQAALAKENLTDSDCLEALREHGLTSVVETREVVLEADGSLSVVPKDPAVAHRRRHVRFVRH